MSPGEPLARSRRIQSSRAGLCYLHVLTAAACALALTIIGAAYQLFLWNFWPSRKRALLIGIKYQGKKNSRLKGTHGDVDCVRRLLVENYGFLPPDITVMKDAAGIDPHLWPTKQNISRELQTLTRDCSTRDRFFFLYAGHAGMTTRGSNGDGQHTYIVPCDALDEDDTGFIMNNDLHSYLVKPLRSQCQLVAFLDACHSATLLVPHDVRGLGLRERFGEATPSPPRQHSHARTHRRPTPFISYALREPTTNSFDISVTDPQLPTYFDDGIDDAGDCCPRQMISAVKKSFARPWHLCQEFCRRFRNSCDPHFLCISASKGDESTIEMRNLSMTKILVRVLERDPNPSLASLILKARQEFLEEYENRKRAYAVKRMRKNHRRGSRDDSTLRSVPGECISTPPTEAKGSPEPHTILWPPLGEIQMSSNQTTRSVTERFVI